MKTYTQRHTIHYTVPNPKLKIILTSVLKSSLQKSHQKSLCPSHTYRWESRETQDMMDDIVMLMLTHTHQT